MKTLCVYCSRSGLTENIIKTSASALDADVVEITDGKDYSGVWGYLKACVTGLRKAMPVLQPVEIDWSQYDRLILGAPIWTENVSPIARAFLIANADRLPEKMYWVITHMSALPYDKPIRALMTQVGREPTDWISVSTKKCDDSGKIRSFLERIGN